MSINSIAEMDRKSVLHPGTQLSDFANGKLGDPTIIETASGIRIVDAHGRQYIDGFAGLYCMNIGYGRTEVVDAMTRQASRLAYYHAYAAHTTNELATLSERLIRMAPGNMSKVFYGTSGSDANETQAKLVWYYNNLRGLPKKMKIISRERGYHGNSAISGSMTGMGFYHANMNLPLPVVLHTGAPDYYRGALPGESELEFSQRRADELETLILKEGPDTVGGFIGEPVLGTGGIVPPPDGYWTAIQKILNKYDILLIADEVICGFGRTGAAFGSHRYGIEPDLVTVAKGLTSAYFPMSAAIVSAKVFRVLEDNADRTGAFSHGYTYSGHPVGAAVANAVLDIVERENLTENAQSTGAYFLSKMREAVVDVPVIGEVRGVGLLLAIEFMADRQRRTAFDPSLKVAIRVASAARSRGLIARALPVGDVLGFAPPLTTTKSDVDDMVLHTAAAIREVALELK